MRTYEREHYKLKAYEDGELCKIIVEDENMVNEEYDTFKVLYDKSKKLVRDGKRIEIWECRYEFLP